MGELVVEGVGEGGGTVVIDRHTGVVREVGFVQHREHVVTTDGQEGSSDTSDILHLHSSKTCNKMNLEMYDCKPFTLLSLSFLVDLLPIFMCS